MKRPKIELASVVADLQGYVALSQDPSVLLCQPDQA